MPGSRVVPGLDLYVALKGPGTSGLGPNLSNQIHDLVYYKT